MEAQSLNHWTTREVPWIPNLTIDIMYGVSLYGKFRSAVIMYFMPTDIFSYTCEHTAQTGGEQTPSHCVLGGTCEAEASQLTVSGTQGLHGGITGPCTQRPAHGPAASRGGSRDPGESPALKLVQAPLRPGQNARAKWDVGSPRGISYISSSNPPLGGGHGRNFANDPVENEEANRFSVSAEVDRSSSVTQRLQSTGSKRGDHLSN